MPITRRFTVYTNAGVSVPPVIHVNQYDRGETWIFTLLEPDGSKYSPASGGIVGIKADGHAIINTATVNSNGEVVVSETQQMTAAAGKAVYEIIFDNSTHGTANFIVCVEPKPGDNATLSDSDLSLIQEAIDSTIPANIEASVQDWMDDNLAPAEWVIDNTLSIAGAAADAKKVGDVTSELKTKVNNLHDELFNSETEGFSYTVGAGLTRTSPWMGTTKYGIQINSFISELTFAFSLALRGNCSVTFELRDENNTVYGTQTNAYTVANEGDTVNVSVTYSFNTPIKAGQYYLWILSDTASYIGYGYSSAAFPSFTHITLTADGGYAGGVNAETLNSYRMLLNASISGESVNYDSRLDSIDLTLSDVTSGTRNIAYFEQGALNFSDGAEIDMSTRCRTNFIPIDTDTSLYITRGLWCVANGYGYDENKNYVANNQFLSDAYADEGRPFRVTNSSIKYVRFVYRGANDEDVTPSYSNFMVERGVKTGEYVPYKSAVDYEARAEIEVIKATPPKHLSTLCEGIDNVAVCGDSLVFGTTLNASAVARTNPNWSWVKRLAVRSGNNWMPYGRAGLTLQTWLTDSAGLPAMLAGTSPEVIIISLGTNDAVGSDYLTAFESNYETLLTTLHTNYPNAIIMCLPLWNFAATRTAEYRNTAEVIQSACEDKTYAYFIDMSMYEKVLKNNYFTQSRVSAHYNSLAYAWIADIIAYCIGNVIESNPTGFAYINFIDA